MAGKMLEKAKSSLAEQNPDFYLLQTNIEKGGSLYGKVGFFPAERPYIYQDNSGGTHEVKAKDVMVAEGKDKKVLADILSSDSILNVGSGDW